MVTFLQVSHASGPSCPVSASRPGHGAPHAGGIAGGIAPRGTIVAHTHKMYAEQDSSLDNLGNLNARRNLESGMYPSESRQARAPRGCPCRASCEQLAGPGEGRRRWSDDFRALGVIWARTWRRCHGNNQLLGTRAATQVGPVRNWHYLVHCSALCTLARNKIYPFLPYYPIT